MDYLTILVIGLLGGFAGGFKVATMIRLGPKPEPKPVPDAELIEDFA